MSETPRTDAEEFDSGLTTDMEGKEPVMAVPSRLSRTLETELTAVRGMLDRIAAVVVDRFDPKSEECIADGVDSLVDELTAVRGELAELRDVYSCAMREHAAVRGELESESAWAHEYHSNQVQLEKQVETLTKERDEARAMNASFDVVTADLNARIETLTKERNEARDKAEKYWQTVIMANNTTEHVQAQLTALQKAVGEAHKLAYTLFTPMLPLWVRQRSIAIQHILEGKPGAGWWNCQKHGETPEECKCGAATHFNATPLTPAPPQVNERNPDEA